MAELSAAIDESFGDHDSRAAPSNGRMFGGRACQISFASIANLGYESNEAWTSPLVLDWTIGTAFLSAPTFCGQSA